MFGVVDRDRLFGEAILRELSRAVVEVHLKTSAGEDISLDTSTLNKAEILVSGGLKLV